MRLVATLLLLAAARASATPVSVCRDATYDVPASRGAICSGAGASPAGKACPLKGDAALESCHPYLPSFNGQACVAKEDAVCEIVNGQTWGCVFPSVGCANAKPTPAPSTLKPTPAPTTLAPFDNLCPHWDFEGDDVVVSTVFDEDPEAPGSGLHDKVVTSTSYKWYRKEVSPTELSFCAGGIIKTGEIPPDPPEPTTTPTTAPPTTAPPTTAAPVTTAPTTAPPTTAPPTTAPPTTAPPTVTPTPTTPAPTTPAPTTPAPTTPTPTTPTPTTPTPTTPPPAVDCVVYPIEEDPGSWSGCAPDSSGKYYRTRVLGIKTPASNGGKCPSETDPSRALKELCNPLDCVINSKDEETSPYSDCAPDSSGFWYKARVLGIKTPASNGGKCPDVTDLSRIDRVQCTPVDCVVKTKEEDTGAYGDCADDGTGVWYKSRVLGIKTEAKYGGKCPTPAERVDRLKCDAVDCVINSKAEDTGAYSDCANDGTNKWFKTRVLGIKTQAKFGGKCPSETDPSRVDSVRCEPVDCVINSKEEDKTPFSDCTNNGAGVWYRTRVLGIKTAAQYGGNCPSESDPKRIDSIKCDPVNCVINSKEEDKGAYSDCKDNGSNVWFRSRVLGIKTLAQYGGTCPGENDPVRIDTVKCDPMDCVVKTVGDDSGDYSTCFLDVASGKYIKTKVLGIKEEAKYGGKCPSEAERTVSASCPAVDCVVNTPEEEKSPYGDCKDNGSNVWYKSRVLGIKKQAENGGQCPPPEQRMDSVLCDAVACVVKTPEEETGEFGDCTDDGTNKWYKSRVLGIKVDAKYGGSCPAPADRMQKVLCDPINCVINSKEEDKGPFGDCTKEDYGKNYYKSRVLGIKTQAKYGGTCPDENDPARQDRVLCPAENCVVKTEEEDDGSFGECADNGSGTWFQYKVLGIKTDAKYGGDCPSEKERTVQKVCKAVDCVVFTEDEDKNPLSPCTDLGNNTFYQTKVLGIKTGAIYGGKCPSEADRTVKKLCPAVDCVVKTVEEETSPYGNCTAEDYSNTYYQSRVLGIKVQPEYGGKACPPEWERIDKKLCPGVDCVVNTPEEDKTPYGDCQPESPGSSKWFKSRVLGIKTQPQYGGKACPSEKDRTDKVLCPAVDCVVYKPEEDPGSFSNCTSTDGGKTYYKSKVLGIKTPAQNGGKCPSEADRTYKVLCPSQCGATTKGYYKGNEIKSIEGLELAACCDACAKTGGCVGYSFKQKTGYQGWSSTECSLKWKLEDFHRDSDYLSASVTSPKPSLCTYSDDSARFSWKWINIKSVWTSDLDECCTACKATRGCVSFTVFAGVCDLKSEKGDEIWVPFSRSGLIR